MRNQGSNVLDLKLTAEEILAHIYLLQIPGSVRADLESRFPVDTKEVTFQVIGAAVNSLKRANGYQLNQKQAGYPTNVMLGTPNFEITAVPGLIGGNKNTPAGNKPDTQAHNPKQNQRGGRGRGKPRGSGFRGARGRGGSQPPTQHRNLLCFICEKEGHIGGYCTHYTWGPDMRRRLQEIGRCDACLMLERDHKNGCKTKDLHCETCGGMGHYPMTCDGRGHPGSWVLKQYASTK